MTIHTVDGTPSEATDVRQLALVLGDITNSAQIDFETGGLAVYGAFRGFFRRVEELCEVHHGEIVKTMRDSFIAVFEQATDALTFATALQKSLRDEPIRAADSPVQMAVCLHVGNVLLKPTVYGRDVFGEDVGVIARLSSRAAPGEVIVSEAARLALPEAVRVRLGPTEQATFNELTNPVAFSRLNAAQD